MTRIPHEMSQPLRLTSVLKDFRDNVTLIREVFFLSRCYAGVKTISNMLFSKLKINGNEYGVRLTYTSYELLPQK